MYPGWWVCPLPAMRRRCCTRSRRARPLAPAAGRPCPGSTHPGIKKQRASFTDVPGVKPGLEASSVVCGKWCVIGAVWSAPPAGAPGAALCKCGASVGGRRASPGVCEVRALVYMSQPAARAQCHGCVGMTAAHRQLGVAKLCGRLCWRLLVSSAQLSFARTCSRVSTRAAS